MKKLLLVVLFCATSLLLVPLFSASQEAGAEPVSTIAGTATSPGPLSTGELIYVPVYSRIYYEDSRSTLDLATTLAIHNINSDRTITLTKVDYYNTAGKLVRKYLEKPVVLNPMEATTMLVEKSDNTGGLAANFVVEWQAKGEVNSPIVEAVMINASHNLGVSLTSVGKVVRPLTSR